MHSPKKFTRNLVLVFSLLLVSSCGADGSTSTAQTEDTETVATSEASSENLSIDAKAQFTATLLNGATFDSATVLQSQPLALWFWAPG
ncbi:MAG: hypothetical protein CK542_03590 [Acidimicrobium sp.]|nr:MAG: hypothetical protein CK542_03590 [Acidimicrobium sp.]